MYSTELGYPDFNVYSANEMIQFNEQSNFYAMAQKLGSWNQILMYMQAHFHLDYAKVGWWIQHPYAVPDIERCFKNKCGTAFELSALLTAMARICKIPAIYTIGRDNNKPYAWVELDGDILDPAAMVTRNRNEINYVAERFY